MRSLARAFSCFRHWRFDEDHGLMTGFISYSCVVVPSDSHVFCQNCRQWRRMDDLMLLKSAGMSVIFCMARASFAFKSALSLPFMLL